MKLIPRFIVKWNNGVWKVFDRAEFKDVDVFDSQKAAEAAVGGAR